MNKIGSENFLSRKKMSGPEKVLVQKQILGPKNSRLKKVFGEFVFCQDNLWLKYFFGSEKYNGF